MLAAPDVSQASAPPRDERTPASFRLLRYFSIASGLAVLLVTVVIAWTYHWSEVRDQVEMAELRNVMLAQVFTNSVWPQFSSHLLRNFGDAKQILDSPEHARLHRMLRSMSRNVPVVKIKIYNAAGFVVYSSVPREIGEDKGSNPAFGLARGGQAKTEFYSSGQPEAQRDRAAGPVAVPARTGTVVSELTHRGQMSVSEGVIENVDVVSTYIPVAIRGDQTEAVFELYTDITEFVTRIQRTTWQLVLVLALIFGAFYGVLLLIVARADRMLQRQYRDLQASEVRIRTQNRELESEVAERRQFEAALRRSEAEAAAASQAKSEFLSRMSHELRTPMNAILGFAQLLGSEPEAPLKGPQPQFVEQILKAGRHLLQLINEVLDLASIEAGKITLSLEPVSVGAVIHECLPLIENMARQKQVRVETAAAIDGVRVMADYVRLKQAVLNLLSNAIKYNRTGGDVRIDVAPCEEGRIRISVKDSGLGIPEVKKGDLFQPFNRLGVNPLEVEGTGIGLALTRNLVAAMGGQIGFDSVYGTGSTFWVELPVATAPELPPAEAVRQPEEEPVRSRVEHSILYIEDNPANVMLMEQVAKRVPARFLTAHTAELGIEVAALEKPDLIVVDINLPGMDGYAALRALKRRAETAAIPVMALTAHAMERDVTRGIAAGFVRYVAKPIRVDELCDAMRAELERRR